MQDPIRIVSFGSLPPEWKGTTQGGVATFHRALVEELTRDPHTYNVDVSAIVPFNVTDPTGMPDLLRIPPRKKIASWYSDLLDELRPDVVVFNHIAHKWAVTHAREKPHIPAVGIVHSWHAFTFAAEAERAERAARIQEAADGLEALVFPSRFSLEEGLRLGFSYPTNTEVVHYPLTSSYLGISRNDVLARERDGVSFVGSLIERKNPALLIQACIQSGLPLRVAGEGEQRLKLEQLVRSSTSADVTLMGPLSPFATRDLLLGSQVLCLPSASESFGIVFIEALACGTPVVGFAGTLNEIFETIGIRAGVALEEITVESVAVALQEVAHSSWDRDALRRTVQQRFALSLGVSRYAHMFRTIANG